MARTHREDTALSPGIKTEAIREDCHEIPAEAVREGDLVVRGQRGSMVTEVSETHIHTADGDAIDREAISFAYYRLPEGAD